MPSHFSDIGFFFDENNLYDELTRVLESLMKESSREIAVDGKAYLVLCVDQTVEIWLPVGANGEANVSELELHYNTERWDKIINPEWVSKECDGMKGIVSFWDPDFTFPMNVMIPNTLSTPRFREETEYLCQIACFAEKISIYKSQEDFRKEHKSMSVQAFIPIGQFADQAGEQTPRSLIFGIVKDVKEKFNSFTQKAYYHFLLESYDMFFDVLVDSESASELERGDIVSVTVWMTGKIKCTEKDEEKTL